jgi:small subunit ribosomal protein S20
MPNTKSAERRVRSNARRQELNQSKKSRVKTLEKKYNAAIQAGNKEEATATLSSLTSAMDKSCKTGSLHKNTAGRKKSRLSAKLSALSTAS